MARSHGRGEKKGKEKMAECVCVRARGITENYKIPRVIRINKDMFTHPTLNMTNILSISQLSFAITKITFRKGLMKINMNN